MPKAKKPKSLTILGVRGLRVHARTPISSRPVKCATAELYLRDAAVQAMLWERDYAAGRTQKFKWHKVFDRAMKHYEKEQKR